MFEIGSFSGCFNWVFVIDILVCNSCILVCVVYSIMYMYRLIELKIRFMYRCVNYIKYICVNIYE